MFTKNKGVFLATFLDVDDPFKLQVDRLLRALFIRLWGERLGPPKFPGELSEEVKYLMLR